MPSIVLPEPGPHMLPKLAHPARHKILCMGRRWRKTTLGIIAGICGHGPDRRNIGALQGGHIWLIGQSYPESTSVWEMVRDILRPVAKHVSEANRKIRLHSGGSFSVKSAVNPNSLVGDIDGIDGVIMNEAAKYNPLVWQKAIRPALSDRKGWSLWPSTPEGFNFFQALYANACGEHNDNGDPDWYAWQEPSTANPFFDQAEIEASRREGMTELMIQQEYYAQFILMGPGRTYPEFTREAHLRSYDVDSSLPLDLCVNFKIAPAAWLVVQGDASKNQPERVLDEIIPEGSDMGVRAYHAEFARRYPDYAFGKGVRIYGDASPALNGRSVGSSDYEMLRALMPRAQHYVRMVPADEKDRVNVVNNTLRDLSGVVHGYVDPTCVRLIRDLEYTRNTDASYAVDHKTPGLGHYAHAWSCKLLYVYPQLAHRMTVPENDRHWPQATPEAKRAHGAVYRAVKKGTLQKPNACQKCGAKGYVEAAHKDYSRPLDVDWLCKRCHTIEDLTAPKGGVVRH